MAENINDINVSGNVQISEEVIAVVSGIASMEIDGVIGMAESLSSSISKLIGKKSLTKGVKSEIEGEDVKIVASIVVKYGCKIPDVAYQVQQNIKKAVENMTGLNVTKVDVSISGIQRVEETAETTEE